MVSLKPTTYFQLKGYPGLQNMAPMIKPLIPSGHLYVEPFAGMGRTAEPGKHTMMVLNDLSDVSRGALHVKYPDAIITADDFAVCIRKWDSSGTVFLIDPPWRKNIYQNNTGPVCDRTPIAYYDALLKDILPTTRGRWVLCVDRDEHEIGCRVSRSHYRNVVLEHPSKKLFGRPIAVRLAFSENWGIL